MVILDPCENTSKAALEPFLDCIFQRQSFPDIL